MRAEYRLTASQPAQSISLGFDAVAISVVNWTGSPIYVRLGAADTPDQKNADLIVPSAIAQNYPTQGRSFGLAVDSTSLIGGTAGAISGLFNTAFVTFLSAGEVSPTFGSYPFASLSLTDVYPLAAFASGYIGPFDLSPWGGLNLLVLPNAGTGQGIAQVEVKQSNPSVATGWSIYASWAFWPGIPLVVAIPRTARYVRILLNSAAIPGDPAVGGLVAVRASLSEIGQLVATPSTSGFVKGVNVGPLGTVSTIYCTVGLEAITCRVNVTVGVRAEVVFYTSSSPAGPWSLVAFREQSVSGFYNSITRTIGQLDAFLRVDILDINGGGLQTNLIMSIQSVPDTTSYLQNIYAALGDVGQPVNANQSIFHILDNSRLYLAAIWAEEQLQSPDIDAIRIAIGAGNLTTILNSVLTAINSTNAKLDTIINNENTQTLLLPVNATIVTAGVFQNVGAFFTPGYYIVGALITYSDGTTLADSSFIQLATGSAAAPLAGFYGITGPTPDNSPGYLKYDGPKSGGYLIPAGHTNLWLVGGNPGMVCSINLAIRAP